MINHINLLFNKVLMNFFLESWIILKNKWVIQVFIISFILSAIFSGVSSFLSDFNVIVLTIIILIVITVGIVFDMVGVAVLTAKEAPFHARSSKKVKEAKACINLLKNSTKVSSVCNDIVGDICGIVSGGLGASLAIYLTVNCHINTLISSILVASFISALTVGGKAYFKTIAIKKSDDIVLLAGKFYRIFNKKNNV